MPSKCFASWASPNWTRPPRRRDKNRSCSDQPQNPPPYLLGVTGHNVKHALAREVMSPDKQGCPESDNWHSLLPLRRPERSRPASSLGPSSRRTARLALLADCESRISAEKSRCG